MGKGERLYVNGTVLRFDRGVGVEVADDAVVLDERHIMHASEVTTPLRQLYFCVQLVLIDPENAEQSLPVLSATVRDVDQIYAGSVVADGLHDVRLLLDRERYYDALIALESLFAEERALHRTAREFSFGGR